MKRTATEFRAAMHLACNSHLKFCDEKLSSLDKRRGQRGQKGLNALSSAQYYLDEMIAQGKYFYYALRYPDLKQNFYDSYILVRESFNLQEILYADQLSKYIDITIESPEFAEAMKHANLSHVAACKKEFNKFQMSFVRTRNFSIDPDLLPAVRSYLCLVGRLKYIHTLTMNRDIKTRYNLIKETLNTDAIRLAIKLLHGMD